MSTVNITILGACSHIAKGLIYNLKPSAKSKLHLYTTSPQQSYIFAHDICRLPEHAYSINEGYHSFMSKKHDVIINCIGVGTQRKIRGDYTKYFIVGEKFDNMIIEYLQNYSPETLYINISSGAVYGRSFTGPVSEWSENALTVNHIMQEDYYSICKLNSEAKHRAFSHLKIVDLRLFSYFSRFADISDGYFITDIIDSIKSNKKLKTNTTNIIRDYVHPVDLCSIVHICIQINNINDAYDVMSTKPVNKTEILDYFSKNYGLKYSIDSSIVEQTPTGVKDIYYSKYFKIAKIGYIPSYSSLDTVIQEASYLLEDKK